MAVKKDLKKFSVREIIFTAIFLILAWAWLRFILFKETSPLMIIAIFFDFLWVYWVIGTAAVFVTTPSKDEKFNQKIDKMVKEASE